MSSQQLRGLSPSTRDLVTKLTSWRTLNQRWHENGETIAILEEIGEASEPAAIPDLMSFGLVRHGEIRAKARSVIRHLFAQVSIEVLPLLDAWLRQSWQQLEDWYGMRPEAIDTLGRITEDDRIFLGLAASHRSGFVRAAAVRALGSDPSGDTIPFVLIRLVDWVSEVQMAAESAIQGKLRPEYAKTFVGCMGLIDRLKSTSRFRAEYSQWIDHLLTRSECVGALKEGMEEPSRGIRRHCYRVAVESSELDVEDVIVKAMGDSDVIVRKWAFTAAFNLFPAGDDTLRSRAARDPYGPIRRIAFDALAANSTVPPQDLMPFLLDRSAAIRRECQSVMSKRTGESPSQFYRARLQNPGSKNVDISALGLAETGSRGDASVVSALLGSRSARVRRAVVRALHILAAEAHEATLLRAVSSEVPAVAREAVLALLSGRTVPADAVWAAALKNTDQRVRAGVLRFLGNVGKWQQLHIYLQAAGDSDSNVSERAIEMLSLWINRFNNTFVQATSCDAETSRRLIETVRQSLPATLATQLDFVLKTAAK